MALNFECQRPGLRANGWVEGPLRSPLERLPVSYGSRRCASLQRRDPPRMTQGKRISPHIDSHALQAIQDMGAAAKSARTQAGEGQSAAAARLGVHVQTIARIESGEPGVAIGHVLGLLALYGITTQWQSPEGSSQSVSPM